MKIKVIILAAIITFFILSFIIAISFIRNLKFESEKEFEIRDFWFFRVEITRLKANVTYTYVNSSSNISYPIGIEIHEKNLLSFGMIPINSPIERVRRILNIENLDDYRAKVKIFCKGIICNFLNISENNFNLNAKEKKIVEISAENKKVEGYFEGYVFVNVFKPKDKIWEFLIFLL